MSKGSLRTLAANALELWRLPGLPIEVARPMATAIVGVATVLGLIQIVILLIAEYGSATTIQELPLQVLGRLIPLAAWLMRDRLRPSMMFALLALTLYLGALKWLHEGAAVSAGMTLIAAASLFCFLGFGSKMTVLAALATCAAGVHLLQWQGVTPAELLRSVGVGVIGIGTVLVCFAVLTQQLLKWVTAQQRILSALDTFSTNGSRMHQAMVAEVEQLVSLLRADDHSDHSTTVDKRSVLGRLHDLRNDLTNSPSNRDPVHLEAVDLDELLFSVKSRLTGFMAVENRRFTFESERPPVARYQIDPKRLRDVLFGSARMLATAQASDSLFSMVVSVARVSDEVHQLRIVLNVEHSLFSPAEANEAVTLEGDPGDAVDILSEIGAPDLLRLLREVGGFYLIRRPAGNNCGLEVELTLPMEPALLTLN